MVKYLWYKDEYGGVLDEKTFARLAARGLRIADAMTQYNLRRRWDSIPEGIRDGVALAICAFVDAAKVEEDGGPVVSETNDGISRTYAAGGGSSGSGYGGSQARLVEVLRLYLAPTGLLYRGCGR